ncbi:Peptidase S1 [Cynara cardunculus var. scolymus]|uniref:Peptidase S1 n=1 Tax=Cynara cardunculus var. scolymus TaxID=59895 RepID=A0A124SHH1_CYNCS|nr:Peptidase S1 [Cynara cardunculus var. scolymus]
MLRPIGRALRQVTSSSYDNHHVRRRACSGTAVKHCCSLRHYDTIPHLSDSPPNLRTLSSHQSFLPNSKFNQCRYLTTAASASTAAVEQLNNGGSNGIADTIDAFSAIELALDSVVKIFTVSSSPNYLLPWQNKSQRESMGSGFVIYGKRIVTNAHVVADHTFVLVRKHGSPTKYRAEVKAVGHECDLAILVVESDEFWEGMKFLELGDIPFMQEAVAVVGYPQGGDNISVTKGVVSRVEPTQYVHGATQLLAIQIDAAINPGNSGGPAIMGEKVAGVAFQNLSGAENIGYIIPVPVIKHFVDGVEASGNYAGFCSLGLSCQPTENIQLREYFGMRPDLTGVLVSKINPLSDAHNVLKKDDIVLAFDGVPIANDGTVTLRPLKPLVPIHQFDKVPSYFVFAGLVFVPLTQPYLHEYGEDWYNTSPRRLCERALRELPKKPGEEIVILSQVKKVNGIEINNLKHMCQLVEECKEEKLRLDLDDERVIVLSYDKARTATSHILKRHRIPSAMSIDLLTTLSA